MRKVSVFAKDIEIGGRLWRNEDEWSRFNEQLDALDRMVSSYQEINSIWPSLFQGQYSLHDRWRELPDIGGNVSIINRDFISLVIYSEIGSDPLNVSTSLTIPLPIRFKIATYMILEAETYVLSQLNLYLMVGTI